jgi:hypothetical protein
MYHGEKGAKLEPTKQPQVNEKYDYSTILFMAVILLTTSQAIENIQTPVGDFIRGVMIGMSIACSVVGLVLYVQSQKKK